MELDKANGLEEWKQKPQSRYYAWEAGILCATKKKFLAGFFVGQQEEIWGKMMFFGEGFVGEGCCWGKTFKKNTKNNLGNLKEI